MDALIRGFDLDRVLIIDGDLIFQLVLLPDLHIQGVLLGLYSLEDVQSLTLFNHLYHVVTTAALELFVVVFVVKGS